MTEPLRVAIVEASPEMHLAIAAVLEGATDLRIVEHARSLLELWAAGPKDIDVVVADLRTCIGSGSALGRLRARYPGLRLVITTENGGPDYEDAVARLAADGCVQKTRLAGHLLSTLRHVPHEP